MGGTGRDRLLGAPEYCRTCLSPDGHCQEALDAALADNPGAVTSFPMGSLPFPFCHRLFPPWRGNNRMQGGETVTTDPVCGARVDEDQVEVKAEYDGQTYYFCSEECKQKFLREPTKYLA